MLDTLLDTLLDGFRAAEKSDADVIALEITSQGGDAEIARRMILEVDRLRARLAPRRRVVFIGKTEVYSAAVTLMAGFPKQDRYLTRDAVLLIHCRQLEKTVEISGPIRASLPRLNALKEQMEVGIGLEIENFKRLIKGSDVVLDDLLERALHNWYLNADKALKRGLVEAIV